MTAALDRGRAMAESLMLDACTIVHPATSGDVDEATGRPSSTAGATVYTGPCKVQSADLEVRNPESGEHPYSLQRFAVHIPVTATGVAVGDVVTITASSTDPAQVGRVFRVASLFRKTFATAQRLGVEEVTG